MQPRLSITRRLFLTGALGIVAPQFIRFLKKEGGSAGAQLTKSDLDRFKAELLSLVNAERGSIGASSLTLDDLACAVAERHAVDMASGAFLSHWGRDGNKPYHRVSFAGGFNAVMENVSSADDLESTLPDYVGLALTQMHIRMHEERPPNDGHRKTILAPQHTNAGFGIALSGHCLRLAELYIADYVRLEPYERRSKPGAEVKITGKLLNPANRFRRADVFYETLPIPREIAWLREPRSYKLPDEFVTLMPKLTDGGYYAGGVTGAIDLNGRGQFRIPVKLFKDKPGVYTVVVWISDSREGRPFQATNACIVAE